MSVPTVHVVDDDQAFRRAAERFLRLSGYAVCQYASAHAFLDSWEDQAATDQTEACVLLDFEMPEMNGLQLLARLEELRNRLPVVFLSGRAGIPTSVKAIKGGAEDFLCKPIKHNDVLEAIRRAIGRNQVNMEKKALLDESRARFDSLTVRQKQVFSLVVSGRLNKQIAHELDTTERTIKAHRQQVMQKLRVRTIMELVSFAARLGALEKTE